jgi:winged helix DNA-binding protein
VHARLRLTRKQILPFRQRAGSLDARLPAGSASLEQAAWAGLQDSMPRAALLSLHARVHGVGPSAWEDPALAQLWGPRFNTYVVAKRDFALFSLGRHPEGKNRERSEAIADRVHAHLDGRRMTDREVAAALGTGNRIRYAATTGTLAIRWEGARAPTVWSVPRAGIEPSDACRELARRYLHIFGPTTADSFARWAGITRRQGSDALASLEPELLPVRTPIGDAWLLASDEPLLNAETSAAPARLLPSGDAYWLLQGAERELLVERAEQRPLLWTPRVWPGALLVDGEIRGTWRRAHATVEIDTWMRLSRPQREAVEAEAATLPLPGVDRINVVWETRA